MPSEKTEWERFIDVSENYTNVVDALVKVAAEIKPVAKAGKAAQHNGRVFVPHHWGCCERLAQDRWPETASSLFRL